MAWCIGKTLYIKFDKILTFLRDRKKPACHLNEIADMTRRLAIEGAAPVGVAKTGVTSQHTARHISDLITSVEMDQPQI